MDREVLHRRAVFPPIDTCRCGCQRVPKKGSAPGGLQTWLCADCGTWRKIRPLGYIVHYRGEARSVFEAA